MSEELDTKDKVKKLIHAIKTENDYKLQTGDLAREKRTGKLVLMSDFENHPAREQLLNSLSKLYYLACKKETIINCTRPKGSCAHCPERKDKLLP